MKLTNATMARDLVLSETLCFVMSNFTRVAPCNLKPVVVTFYTEDELVVAKELLHKSLLDLNIDLPRLVKRKGDGKQKQLVDDIFDLLTVADEKLVMDTLPCFVAADLLRIPVVTSNVVDTISVMKRLDQLEKSMSVIPIVEQKLDEIQTGLTRLTGRSMLPSVETQRDDVSVGTSVGDVRQRTMDDGAAKINAAVVAAGSQVSLPTLTTTSDSGELQQERLSWAMVTRRNAASHRPDTSIPAPSTVGAGQTARSAHAKTIGTGIAKPGGIKACINIVQKAIVHVDNVDPEFSTDHIKATLSENGIQVLSCFPAKSWLREARAERAAEEMLKPKAFRLAVEARHRDTILAKSFWPASVVVREWRFKKLSNPGNIGGADIPDVS